MEEASRGRGNGGGALPSAAYRLKLANEDLVMAHAAGAATVNFVRCVPAIGSEWSFRRMTGRAAGLSSC